MWCHHVACENSRFSLLLDAGGVSRGGTSATQRQTDDVNQCLHNKSGSHGALNANLFSYTFLLVDFCEVLLVFICERAPAKLKCFFYRDSSRLHLTFVAFCLSFVSNSSNKVTTPPSNLWPDSGQILRYQYLQYGISVAESQRFLLAKRPLAAMSEEKRLFSQASHYVMPSLWKWTWSWQ